MLFTSYGFIGFLCILLILYYALPKKCQTPLLLVGSLVFYAFSGPAYLLYLFTTIITTYLAGIFMGRNLDREKEYLKLHKEDQTREERKVFKLKEKKKRRYIFILAVVINIGILAVTKYTNFVIDNLNAFGAGLSFINIALPLGISYYTLQSVGYMIDIYRETIVPEKNPVRYALFLSFFPQIVQGPISRYKELSETLYDPHDLDGKNIAFGIQRILFGFFKKLVIADRLYPAVATIAGDVSAYRGAYTLCLMFFYTLELYADFTGGIDITIGTAEIFGIRLTENFERPFFSKSLKEYWRRWHISMGAWFRDYLFYPIAMSHSMQSFSRFLRNKFGEYAGKRIPVYISSFIVWFMTGLWHGASWNFIVWGLLNYVILMISEELEPLYERFHKRFSFSNTRGFDGFMVIRTTILVSCLKVFDCYTSVGDVFSLFASIFTEGNFRIFGDGSLLSIGMDISDYAVVAVCTLLLFIISMIQRKGSVRERISALPFGIKACIWSLLFVSVIMFGAYGIGYDASQFIYNRF